MRTWFILAALLLAGCMRAPEADRQAVDTQTVYERYAALQQDPAFKSKLDAAAQRDHELDWMIGAWNVTVDVDATPASPARHETLTSTFHRTDAGQIVSDDLSTILVYDPFSARWVNAGSEPPAAPFNVQTAAGAWDGATLVFEGDAQLLGERFALRQTMHKLSDGEWEIVNEQRTGPDHYVRVDRYLFARAPASN